MRHARFSSSIRFLAFALVLAFAACEAAETDTSPRAFNLQASGGPFSVGLPAQVTGSVFIEDSDADLARLFLALSRPDGSSLGQLELPISSNGQVSGGLPFSFELTADREGTHLLTAWVVDQKGQESNRVSTTLSVAAADTTPSLSNLQVVGGELFLFNPIELSGTIDWVDGDQDLATLQVRVLDVRNQPMTETTVSVVETGSAGTSPFSITVTAREIGSHKLEVTAIDAAGNTSRTLSKTLSASVSPTAPVIRNLDLDNTRAYVDIESRIPVAFDFTDSDGDLRTLRVRVTRPDGSPLLEREVALDADGQTTGSLVSEVLVTAPALGRYTLYAALADNPGQRSAELSLTFDALAAQTTAPSLTNLQLTVPVLHPNLRATLTGSIDIADIDANTDTVVVSFVRLGSTTPLATTRVTVTPDFDLTASFTLDVTPLSLGLHQLVAVAEDRDGQTSVELTRNLDVVTSPTAPDITDLALPNVRAFTGIATAIALTVDFTDDDANVTTLQARIVSPSGATASNQSLDLPAVYGLDRGEVSVSLPFTAQVAGRHTLTVSVSDASGEVSNTLTLTFDVTTPSSTAPRASALLVSQVDAVAGKASTLSGSLRFEDVDANTNTLVLRVLAPDQSVIVNSRTSPAALSGVSGLVPFALAFTPTRTGYHTLEVWLEDADTQVSTRLSRGFEVTTSPTAPTVIGLDLGSSRGLVNVATTLSAAITFVDTDTNTNTVVLRILAPGGAEVLTAEKAVAGSGPLAITQAFTAQVEGRHTFECWLRDAAGETSNRVSRTFDALRTNTTPIIRSWSATVPTLLTNTSALITGQISFSDVDANVATLLMRLLGPDNTVVFEANTSPSVASQDSGFIDFELAVEPTLPGVHVLELWLQDAAGQSSARVSRTVTVLDTRPLARNLSVVHDQLFATKTSTISGSVELTDHDANLATLEVIVQRPDGTTLAPVSVELDEGVTQVVVSFPVTLTPPTAGTYVLRVSALDLAQQRSVVVTRELTVFDTSNVASACSALDFDCTGQGFCYDVNASTCDYFEDRFLETPAVCDDVTSTGSQALCVSSTTDPVSPLITDANRCHFVQYWSHPTDLPMDCRCPEARFDQRCLRPYFTSQATSFGSGPRIRALANTIQPWSGIVLGREWLLPVRWSTSNRPYETMIFAIHLDTGNRRYFSGAYNDPANGYTSVGNGAAFTQVMDLELGADGQIYAVGATSDIAAPKIWRIHPTTGDRTLLFDEATATESQLCPNFSSLPGRKVVQMATQGFTMDEAGHFYFSNIGMPGPSILRMTIAGVMGATTTSCSYLTRVMDCPLCTTQDNVGTGWDTIQFDMTAFEIQGDKLYAVTDKRFISVALASGHRSLVSFASDVGAIGTGPINAEGLADRYTTWDPHREVFWTTGVLGGSWAVAVDPDTGNRTPWPCFHPSRGVLPFCGGTGMALTPGPLNFGGMVIDPLPPHDLFFAHDGFAIVKYEVETGNAYNFSL